MIWVRQIFTDIIRANQLNQSNLWSILGKIYKFTNFQTASKQKFISQPHKVCI